jgi:hypothetical protein
MHSAGSGPGSSVAGLLQQHLGAGAPPSAGSSAARSGGLQRPSSAPAPGKAVEPLGGGGELPFGRERHLSVAARRELQQLRADLDTVRGLA